LVTSYFSTLSLHDALPILLVEETTNAVLAQRSRAFERLFNIVVAILLVGSAALTLYATWLSSRIRRLARDAEAAIDRDGRVRGPDRKSTRLNSSHVKNSYA